MSTIIFHTAGDVGRHSNWAGGEGETPSSAGVRQDKRAKNGARAQREQPALMGEPHHAHPLETTPVRAEDPLDVTLHAVRVGRLVQSTNWIPQADAEEILHLARTYGISKSAVGAVLIRLGLQQRLAEREAALRDARMEYVARKFTTKLSRVEKRLDDIEQVGLATEELTAEVLKRQSERRMPPEQFNTLYDDAQQDAKDRLFQRQQQRRAAAAEEAQGQGGGREATSLWQSS